METAARQVLRALRGKRSQRAFSRKLGFRTNTSADWEAGRRFPTAATFLKACQRTGVNVAHAMAAFAPSVPCSDPLDVSAWLQRLRGSSKLVEIAKRTGQSRFAIARWFNGTGQPRLPDFLRLLEGLTGRASDLVALLVNIEHVPALVTSHHARQAARRMAYEQPWTEAVLRVLETPTYQNLGAHIPGWIADCLGFDENTEGACLACLEQAGVITLTTEGYRAVCELIVDTRTSPSATNKLKQHWTQVALGRIPSARPSDSFGYNVVSLSSEDLEKVRQLLRQTFREIRSLVAKTNATEAVALVNLQLVSWKP